MNNKCCRINETQDYDPDELYHKNNEDGSLNIYYITEILFNYAYGLNDDTPPRNQAGWMPIIVDQDLADDIEGFYPQRPLAPPKNTGTVTFDPLNCSNAQFVTDPTRVADPKSASVDCQYCEDFGNAVGTERGTARLRDAKGNEVNTGSYTCCNGNCDVRTNQSDVDHNIPYVLPQYVDQWGDNKYKLQFPDVYRGINVVDHEYATYKDRACTWELIPTIGEIPYDPSTSQYNNKRDHELAIEKANVANRMAGNFIVFKMGPQELFFGNENATDWYKEQIEPCLGEFGYLSKRDKDFIDVDLPTPEEFTVPYGFNDGTQNNVFIGRNKRTSWWKWEIEEAPIAWVLRQGQGNDTVVGRVGYVEETYIDEEGKEQTRATNQWDHQFWIPPGDMWIAKNKTRRTRKFNEGRCRKDRRSTKVSFWS